MESVRCVCTCFWFQEHDRLHHWFLTMAATTTAAKTLPASWYCSQNLYHLEQRAVFYKAWYLVGAVPRFAVDKEVEYEFAGVGVTVRHEGDEKFTVTRKADVRECMLYRPILGLVACRFVGCPRLSLIVGLRWMLDAGA